MIMTFVDPRLDLIRRDLAKEYFYSRQGSRYDPPEDREIYRECLEEAYRYISNIVTLAREF